MDYLIGRTDQFNLVYLYIKTILKIDDILYSAVKYGYHVKPEAKIVIRFSLLLNTIYRMVYALLINIFKYKSITPSTKIIMYNKMT